MDWKLLIENLRASGLSLTDISARTGFGVSTISEIAQGRTREPRGTLAMTLVALATERGYAPELPSAEHRHAA